MKRTTQRRFKTHRHHSIIQEEKTNKKHFLVKLISWLLWEFSGARYIAGKIHKPWQKITYFNSDQPPTFLLWFIGLYVALFGIASQRYENRIDVIENRANSVITQISILESRKYATGLINDTQKMTTPVKPDIISPKSLYLSFTTSEKYQESVNLLVTTIENYKEKLTSANLNSANLEGAHLFRAHLEGAYLIEANLEGAHLNKAHLEGAVLFGAHLEGAELFEANLEGAYLNRAHLEGVKNVTFQQLASTKSLFGVTGLNSSLENKLRKAHPELFIEPVKPFE